MDLLDMFKNIFQSAARILYKIFSLDYSLLSSEVFYAIVGAIIAYHVVKTIVTELMVFPAKLLQRLIAHFIVFLAQKIGLLCRVIFARFRFQVNTSVSAQYWQRLGEIWLRGKEFFLKIWYETRNQ